MKKSIIGTLAVMAVLLSFSLSANANNVAVPDEMPSSNVSARAWQSLPHNARLFRSSTVSDALGIIHSGTWLHRGSRANNRSFCTFNLQPNSNGWSGSAWINNTAFN